MSQFDYDDASPESILEFAKRLSGKTLAQAVDMSQVMENLSNKGDLGTMVEKYYFHREPNSSSEPDFPEAGVELKTTGVKRNTDGGYQAKERLVLTMINYMELAGENWTTSSLMQKCRLMLIVFYIYEKNIAVINRRFEPEPILFHFPTDDLVQIELDWQKIKEKVENGEAHELSEGDTYYLGACRKGSGGPNEALRRQPFSDVPAMARAFSLKPRYLNKILEGRDANLGVLDVARNSGIEEATRVKFAPYLGKTVSELSNLVNFHQGGKGFYRGLTMRMLGVVGKKVPELEKAGIEVKTIRVNKNWKSYESMSFPGFKYMEIVNEDWEDSNFFQKIEQRFLFVIFREGEDGELRLEKILYWNMPYRDREEARRVWEMTKACVAIDASVLPKSKDSRVAHVRPKGKNSRDTLPTPQGTNLVKKCFWLNSSYLNEIVQNA
jgi:DNA mismatch repair protein MutH